MVTKKCNRTQDNKLKTKEKGKSKIKVARTKIIGTMFILIAFFFTNLPESTIEYVKAEEVTTTTREEVDPIVVEIPKVIPEPNKEVSDLIKHYAKEYGADEKLALNVACAESCMRDGEDIKFNTNAKNPRSTASGVFQFIKGTWEHFCDGEVFDPDDNVKCGVKLLANGGIAHWEASRQEGFGGGWEKLPYEKFNVAN